MEIRKTLMILSVLIIWIISGTLAHTYATGRAAKILEDPIVPQDWNNEFKSEERYSIKDTSDRSLTVENNMMLYRSVFALSLKLLSVFLIIKLFSSGLTSAGLLRQKPLVPLHPSPQLLYTVDVNHNPGLQTLLTQSSTGAAAGASTGGAAGVVGVVPQAAPINGYVATAATNPRPSFLLPRFRFGGSRHPLIRPRHPRPPPHMMGPGTVSHHNMGEETHLVETHSHVYVLPDGSQTRVPLPTTVTLVPNPNKPATATSSQTVSQTQNNPKPASDSASSASTTSDRSTERPANAVPSEAESISISTSSSSSSSSSPAERRSSTVFREKHPPLHHQHYDDWNLHLNPGTKRSL